mmetsp:Transcript_79710/g.228775  ORF Transcript_79710/g.228775 Transcript_79710/m.228775 type:complete len:299 (-) Transcript_79710:399-1295(-)
MSTKAPVASQHSRGLANIALRIGVGACPPRCRDRNIISNIPTRELSISSRWLPIIRLLRMLAHAIPDLLLQARARDVEDLLAQLAAELHDIAAEAGDERGDLPAARVQRRGRLQVPVRQVQRCLRVLLREVLRDPPPEHLHARRQSGNLCGCCLLDPSHLGSSRAGEPRGPLILPRLRQARAHHERADLLNLLQPRLALLQQRCGKVCRHLLALLRVLATTVHDFRNVALQVMQVAHAPNHLALQMPQPLRQQLDLPRQVPRVVLLILLMLWRPDRARARQRGIAGAVAELELVDKQR